MSNEIVVNKLIDKFIEEQPQRTKYISWSLDLLRKQEIPFTIEELKRFLLLNRSSSLSQSVSAAGCAAKYAKGELTNILEIYGEDVIRSRQLVRGLEGADDASLFEINSKDLLINTVDIITPIVDDPYIYGRIAATNSISDVYAMNGTPLHALTVVGWDNSWDNLTFKLMLKGVADVARENDFIITGGHTVKSSDMFIGLSVTGMTTKEKAKTNGVDLKGDETLVVTKPVGIGLLTSNPYSDVISAGVYNKLINILQLSNRFAKEQLEPFIKQVVAMTDITGFGFAGHLKEMLLNSKKNVSAVIDYEELPLVDFYTTENLANEMKFPGGTRSNFNYVKNDCDFSELERYEQLIACDACTSGGLLIAFSDPNSASEYVYELNQIYKKLNIDIEATTVGKTENRTADTKLIRFLR